jgi:hypothetical protein
MIPSIAIAIEPSTTTSPSLFARIFRPDGRSRTFVKRPWIERAMGRAGRESIFSSKNEPGGGGSV